jgi:hypothetical protein
MTILVHILRGHLVGSMDIWYILWSSVLVCCTKKNLATLAWDRCYDFLNIFGEKFGEKVGISD